MIYDALPDKNLLKRIVFHSYVQMPDGKSIDL